MPRLIPAIAVVILSSLIVAGPAAAQAPRSTGTPVMHLATTTSGIVQGVVRDGQGHVLPGASIIAVGTTLASVRTDARGKFRLPLPPGEYVLRAARVGYLSNYREPVRIQSSVLVERNITLVELDAATAAAPVRAAMGLEAADEAGTRIAPAASGEEHAHGPAAWRLRHLARTILREGGAAAGEVPTRREAGAFTANDQSFVDRAIFGSARAAGAFFADTDFNGQVNLISSGAFGGRAGWLPDDWSRGIASVSVGAPVGALGDWQVRGAMTPGDLSSWVLLGEFQANRDQSHAWRAGMSYGVQGDIVFRGRRGSSIPETRSAGAVYAFDHWRVARRTDLDYGVRIDRYDYVARADRISPTLTVRTAVTPAMAVVASASQRVLAPGANEFLPPDSTGPWLPPERTFSAIASSTALRAERVRHYEVGFDHAIGSAGAGRLVSIRRFHQSTIDQVATLFGLDRTSDVGHYYVTNTGAVAIDGWRVGVSGHVNAWLGGSVSYSTARADWSPERQPRVVRWLVPSAARTGQERLHDLVLSFDAIVPRADTQVKMDWRLSSAFARLRSASDLAGRGSRFDLEVRQALPYQPIRGGRLEVLVALRDLFMDPAGGASIYDELLTVAPPLRLMGGLQIRF